MRVPTEAAHPGKVQRRAGYIALTISSTIFFASANSIMVLSRKKSSFSITPQIVSRASMTLSRP